ncbi:MAG: hypothetical protein M0Z95_29650 [Actinomycetota bacterium]|nr:hypothetical protein [Actinomycetota bacterium]
MPPGSRRPRIYGAHPITCYFTDHEKACLDAIKAAFPEAEVVNPAVRYKTTTAWLRAWPRVAQTLDGLVVFADEAGTVGVGCVKEVADAIRLSVPVAMIDDQYQVRELTAFGLLDPSIRSARRSARLVSGPVLSVSRRESGQCHGPKG